MPVDDHTKEGIPPVVVCPEDAFLHAIYPEPAPSYAERPFVTVTWAQTLDSKIAGPPGSARLMISGPGSMGVTMRMRCRHDAILIGVQTLLEDDPRLMVRELPMTQIRHPRPIIIDSRLETPLDSRLMKNVRAGISPAPLIVATSAALSDDTAATIRSQKLHEAGATVICAANDGSGRVDLQDALRQLKAQGVQRLMVEGGARMIVSFLSMPQVIDRIVITIGPVFALPGSRGPTLIRELKTKCLRTQIFGDDTVIACAPERS